MVCKPEIWRLQVPIETLIIDHSKRPALLACKGDDEMTGKHLTRPSWLPGYTNVRSNKCKKAMNALMALIR